MTTKQSGIANWIKRALKEEPPRSKSLIVTLFGDSLAPHVPGIWLSELIQLLKPFHVNERLVRTSTFRLAEEGWLESQREGRRSRYSLTASGMHRVQHAYRRIYAPPPKHWNGVWTAVILSKTGNLAANRAELRRELEWEGFGGLAPGIAIHPCPDVATLTEILDRLRLTQNIIVLQARDLDSVSSRPASVLAEECWNLDELAGLYQDFLTRFQPALPLLHEADPQTAFLVQTLLIHSFRRVVLHDPRLPSELLPNAWPGHAAYDLCREIYLRTFQKANHHLAQVLDHDNRHPLTPTKDFYRRLGGLSSQRKP
jgi:phenylacetic acid degradation operon negative regulatory protein